MEKVIRLNENQVSDLITKIKKSYDKNEVELLNEIINNHEDKNIVLLFDIVKRLEDSVKRIEKRMDDSERYYRG